NGPQFAVEERAPASFPRVLRYPGTTAKSRSHRSRSRIATHDAPQYVGKRIASSSAIRPWWQRRSPEVPGVRPSPFADSPEFHRLITGGGPVHLARIALEIAQDAYPDLDVDSYLHRIGALTERVRARCAPGAKVRDVLGQINWVLFV